MIKKRLSIQTLNYRPCAIIIGPTGVGKSTLVNMLCNCNHASEEGDGSVTRNLHRNTVSHGNYPFSLIDTPGTDSDTEAYEHAVLVKHGLTAGKLNTIFIVCKFDTRYTRIIENFINNMELIDDYKSKIVAIVSHWDQCKDKTKAFNSLNLSFESYCQNVIYCSSKNRAADIAELMYSCVSNMNSEQLTISDDDFVLKFRVVESSHADIRKHLNDFEKESKRLFAAYSELVPEVMQDAERDDILYTMNICFRNSIQDIIDGIIQKANGKILEIHCFTLHVTLQKKSIEMCDQMAEMVENNMSYSVNDQTDPRNMIKKCPHCGLVWFKVQGCDGETTCGNLPSSANDLGENRNRTLFRYITYNL
jgi:small GTP-binding protein